MAFDESLAARIRHALARKKGVEEKRCSAASVSCSTATCLSAWREFLIARLGPDQGEEALLEPHVRKMDITGKPMKGWIMVEREGVEDDEPLKNWIQQAMRFVKMLPRK
jgi:hypothetical protein